MRMTHHPCYDQCPAGPALLWSLLLQPLLLVAATAAAAATHRRCTHGQAGIDDGWQACESYHVMPSNATAFHGADGIPIVNKTK